MIEKRNVPAADFTQEVKPWKLTSSQWLVYYWLLSHSNWNSFLSENHYYIYKDKIVQVKIMRDCGIKAKDTVRNAIKKLKEVGALADSAYADAYEIYFPLIYTPLDVKIIKAFIAFNNFLDSAQMIIMYSILRRMYTFGHGKEFSFTAAGLCKLLGKAQKNISKPEFLLMLSLFEHMELVEVKKEVYNNKMGTECVKYTLFSITDTMPEKTAVEFDNDDELSDTWAEQAWKALISKEDA